MSTLDDLVAARAAIDHAIAGLTPPPPPPPPPPVPPPTGKGTRMVMWCNARYVCDMTDAELDKYAAMGVGGFVMQTADLGAAGGQFFTPSAVVPPAPSGAPDRNGLQRQIRQTNIAARCARRGIALWLGFYLAAGNNKATPLVPWNDPDAAWNPILASITSLAAFAKGYGFVGLALDEEMYRGGTWDWNYPGNTHTQPEVRTAVVKRGADVMRAINAGFPNVDLITYGWLIPDSWNGLRVQKNPPAFTSCVNIDFWKGMTSIAGFGALRFWDATFYRGTQRSDASGTWAAALPEARRILRDGFARTLPNWAAVAGKVFAEPFAWIDGIPNTTGFNAARVPADAPNVAAQLSWMAKDTEGAVVGIYSWGRPTSFDYTPFAPGILAASKVGV